MKQHNFKLDAQTEDLLKKLRLLDSNLSMSNVVREAIRELAKQKGVK